MNQYIVNELQAKALSNGASLLIIEIDLMPKELEKVLKGFHLGNLPIKQGDEIFIAEEFAEEVEWCNCPWSCDCEEEYHLLYKSEFDFIQPYTNTLFPSSAKKLDEIDWQPASEMTEQQSRFKRKVGEVSVKRVHGLDFEDCVKLGIPHTTVGISSIQLIEITVIIDWLKDQGIDYSANPLVALAELKDIG